MSLTNVFVPERGLRQGDPLSPYLFLFCMKAFSRLLCDAQVDGNVRGIRASHHGLRINYLFFLPMMLYFFLELKVRRLIRSWRFSSFLKELRGKKLITLNPWFDLALIRLETTSRILEIT